jgi:hypothetical protein
MNSFLPPLIMNWSKTQGIILYAGAVKYKTLQEVHTEEYLPEWTIIFQAKTVAKLHEVTSYKNIWMIQTHHIAVWIW